MNSKPIVMMGLFLGSTIGSFIPNLWGADVLSFSSVIWTAIGGIVGIWVAFKLTH